MNKLFYILISVLALNLGANASNKNDMIETNLSVKYDTVTFGAGCFWCVEAVFQQIDGVQKVVSGYAGGGIKNPTYKEVCSGLTGHAEVCNVIYDPKKVTFEELLEAFWLSHDGTQLNRQGADVGSQYRSVIFYHSDLQKTLSEKYKKRLNDVEAYDKPIITEISKYTDFYVAEDYHQNYFNNNQNQPYCSMVIQPKLEKFRKAFDKEKLVPTKK